MNFDAIEWNIQIDLFGSVSTQPEKGTIQMCQNSRARKSDRGKEKKNPNFQPLTNQTFSFNIDDVTVLICVFCDKLATRLESDQQQI